MSTKKLRPRNGLQAKERFLRYDLGRCLDIGSGVASVIEGAATCDLIGPADYVTDYMRLKCEPFDSIWCCHVLEHQRNPGLFLEKIRNDVKPGGVVCITVPPFRHKMALGHVFLGNEWHLLYNMVLAGFDCSKARVGVYDYNISVIVERRDAQADVGMGAEEIGKFLPFKFVARSNGEIGNINW